MFKKLQDVTEMKTKVRPRDRVANCRVIENEVCVINITSHLTGVGFTMQRALF